MVTVVLDDIRTLPAHDLDPAHMERRRHLVAEAKAYREAGAQPTHEQIVSLHRAGMPLSEIDRVLGLEPGTAHGDVTYEITCGSLGGPPKKKVK